jgi:hypothetical protein
MVQFLIGLAVVLVLLALFGVIGYLAIGKDADSDIGEWISVGFATVAGIACAVVILRGIGAIVMFLLYG